MDKPTIGFSSFVERQTKDSRHSYYAGAKEQLLKLVEENFEKRKMGYRDGVVLVPVQPDGFFSSICKLDENSELRTRYRPRAEGEDAFLVTEVLNGEKLPAKYVDIVLYSKEVLAEDNDNSTDCDWEIISINASTEEDIPMNPITMMRNQLHLQGGTQAEYTSDEYAKAIYFWGKHALCANKEAE